MQTERVLRMNELYAEALVKAKTTPKSIAIRVGLILVAVIAVFFALTSGQMLVFPLAVLVIFGVIYFYPRFSHVEYEYVFCDGQLDFDRISGGSKRKTDLRLDMENMELVAQLGSSYLDNYKNISYKKDYSAGNTDKTYVIIASKNEKQMYILFEPSDKMLECMYYKSPSRVKKNR